jgi:hypothetical protein
MDSTENHKQEMAKLHQKIDDQEAKLREYLAIIQQRDDEIVSLKQKCRVLEGLPCFLVILVIAHE